ncbi:DUF4411 family protein [Terrabacter terrigena]|uniref:DUF4411 family protein n=1 Tax=Terrabacter terrigena TaxID=574718 RepID=A0ABW3N1M8_9MICO
MAAVYVWDTSALIGAWVRAYPPDVFPALWDQIDALGAAGRLMVPEEVLEELAERDDALHGWVKTRQSTLVVPTSRAVMLEARDVLADHAELTKTGTGRGKADPFVIATARMNGCAVVTEERGGSQQKPRIPYVCQQRGVPVHSVLEVIRAEGWTFA